MRRTIPYSIIVLLVFLGYHRTIWYDFAFDDLIHIRDNYTLRFADNGWSSLTLPAFPGNLYRPLTFFSYYVQTQLTGESPIWFHLTNLMLHMAVSLLVFELLRAVLKDHSALAAALIFALHPLHTEAVVNISGRAELLAALFTISALMAAVRPVSIARMLSIALLSLLASSSKESAMMAPVLMFIYLSALRERVSSYDRRKAVVASFAGVSLYIALRIGVLGTAAYQAAAIDRYDNPLAALSLGRRFVEAAALLNSYITKIFIPLPLSADYSFAVIQFGEQISPTSIELGLLAITFCALGISGFKKTRVAPWVVWFFAAFLITGNLLLPIGTVFAERLAYLPSVGILTAAFLLMEPVGIAIWILVVPIAASSLLVISKHAPVWRDTAALASYQEKITPQSFRTQLLCAARDKNRGQFLQAAVHAENALAILPQNEDAYFLLGQIALETVEYARAAASFEKALSINPAHEPSLDYYGRLLLNQNQLGHAREMAQRMLGLRADNPNALLILLAAALKEKNVSQAREIADRLERMRFHSADYLNLKRVLAAQ